MTKAALTGMAASGGEQAERAAAVQTALRPAAGRRAATGPLRRLRPLYRGGAAWLLALLVATALPLSAQQAAPPAFPSVAGSTAQVSAFAQANALYQQGRYAEAQGQYLRQLQQGPVTVALLYNLGNSCYQLGQTGWAILYYERARLAAPRDADLRANLAAALATRRVPPSSTAPGWLQVLWHGALDRFTLDELVALAVLAYLAGCALACLWLRSGQLRRRLKWVLYLALGLLLLFGSLAAGRSQAYHRTDRAVIVADGQLMSGPAESFQALRRVYQGEYARLTREQGMWREVRFESGAAGWVPQTVVEPVVARPPR